MALAYRGPFLLIHAASALTRELLDRHLAGSGLTPNDFAVYSVVRAEEPLTPTRLAEIVGLAPTSLSYTLKQMHERGHLRRLRNPDDGRSVLVELTAKGRRLTENALGGFETAITAFRAELDIDERELLDALEAMTRALERAGQRDAASAKMA